MQNRRKLGRKSESGLSIGSSLTRTFSKGSQKGSIFTKFPQSKTAIVGAMVFAVAFFAAFFASSVLTPTNTSDAADLITATLQSQEYYVKISSSDVAMELITTPTGAMTVANSTVKTATNSPTGYKLYLGMSPYNSSGTEKSAADKLKNGLYLDGNLSRTDGSVINAVSGTGGTSGTPAALTTNTWGYAIDKNSTGIPTIWQNENHTTMTSATPTNDKFAAVPPVGSEELIQTTNTNNVAWDTDPDDIDFTDPSEYTTASVYYGIVGTNIMPSGAYSNTVAYTAVAQAAPDAGSISFSPLVYTRDATYESMVWDDPLTIYTTLYTNMEDLGSATVTLSGGPENAQNLVCTNPTLAVTNNLLNITCTLPAAYAGTYTVNVHLDKFGQDYSGTYTYAATWDTISAMQEMTSNICAEPTTPATSAASSSTTLPAAQFDGSVVPEKFLTDLRGGGGHITGTFQSGYGYQEAYTGKYRIRKLADGNCWMTENMDLPQSTSTVYHSYDTNLAADPNDSSIDQDSYSVDANGIISWTPTNIDGTCLNKSGGTSIPCSPNTIDESALTNFPSGGPIDSNNKNAHSYNGNGSQGTRTIATKTCDKSTNPKCPVITTTTETQGIGTIYDWAAATAQSGGDADNINANNSICPKGWRLPYGTGTGTNKSFYKLAFDTYSLADYDGNSSIAMQSFPLSFVLSGYYQWYTGYGRVSEQNSAGNWWASLSNGSTNAYHLHLSIPRLIPQYRNTKLYVFSIRCVQN